MSHPSPYMLLVHYLHGAIAVCKCGVGVCPVVCQLNFSLAHLSEEPYCLVANWGPNCLDSSRDSKAILGTVAIFQALVGYFCISNKDL